MGTKSALSPTNLILFYFHPSHSFQRLFREEKHTTKFHRDKKTTKTSATVKSSAGVSQAAFFFGCSFCWWINFPTNTSSAIIITFFYSKSPNSHHHHHHHTDAHKKPSKTDDRKEKSWHGKAYESEWIQLWALLRMCLCAVLWSFE